MHRGKSWVYQRRVYVMYVVYSSYSGKRYDVQDDRSNSPKVLKTYDVVGCSAFERALCASLCKYKSRRQRE
ncbi:hypothetical protein QTP88_002479 [Uroleucon formosanum]